MVLRDALGELIWAGEQSRVDSGIEQVEVRRVREGTADPGVFPVPRGPKRKKLWRAGGWSSREYTSHF